jgi:hypothetical protein
MRTGVSMARPARAISDEIEDLDEEGAETEGSIDFEPDIPEPETTRRTSDLRRYMLPLAGLLLVGTLASVAWISFAPRHGSSQDRAVLDLPQPVSATVERPDRKRSISPAVDGMDARLGPAASVSTPRTSPSMRGADLADSASESGGSKVSQGMASHTTEVRGETGGADRRALEERLDRIEISLQGMQRMLESLRTELTAVRAYQPPPQPTGPTEKRSVSPRQRLTIRHQENARRELAVNGPSPGDGKPIPQRSTERVPLPGWEIVGLSARNVALRDPGGRTHVVAIGEVIADDVELTRVDPVANRIITSAGELTYTGAGSGRPGSRAASQ